LLDEHMTDFSGILFEEREIHALTQLGEQLFEFLSEGRRV